MQWRLPVTRPPLWRRTRNPANRCARTREVSYLLWVATSPASNGGAYHSVFVWVHRWHTIIVLGWRLNFWCLHRDCCTARNRPMRRRWGCHERSRPRYDSERICERQESNDNCQVLPHICSCYLGCCAVRFPPPAFIEKGTGGSRRDISRGT